MTPPEFYALRIAAFKVQTLEAVLFCPAIANWDDKSGLAWGSRTYAKSDGGMHRGFTTQPHGLNGTKPGNAADLRPATRVSVLRAWTPIQIKLHSVYFRRI